MSIKIKHRNLEIRKTRNDFSVQVRNFLLPLSLKVLRHKKRDTHSFYSGFYICLPPHLVRRLPKASASKRKSTLLVRYPVLNSTNFLDKIPQILRALPVRDVIRTCQPHFPSGLLWHLWVTRPLRAHARQHLCSSLHLTNPCAEPKGSQPN